MKFNRFQLTRFSIRLAILLAVGSVAALNIDSAAAEELKDVRVKISTSAGNLEAVLYASKTPITVANFCNLAKRKYYDGIIFHRVIADFMAQVGDPLTKQPGKEGRWGTGGPGYTFGDEFRDDLRHDSIGVLSMANAGPRTNGSQIFITHLATPHLNNRHTVFGKITKGNDILLKIVRGDKIVKLEVLDNTDALFTAQKENIDKWNSVLDKQ
ncbi:MAG: peptidyl-prolyl cis-trans isomerase B (cyclophilin B) [Pirellulaceae bacterium]|jgi:peptidyl-prolyl cis-trans isomerase B (cyclophilin B)